MTLEQLPGQLEPHSSADHRAGLASHILLLAGSCTESPELPKDQKKTQATRAGTVLAIGCMLCKCSLSLGSAQRAPPSSQGMGHQQEHE